MQILQTTTPTHPYTFEQINEAEQAINRLACFPESRSDSRITSDLNIIPTQGHIKKIIASLTCNTCCSRRLYDEKTNLAFVYSRFKECVRILTKTGEIQKSEELNSACVSAARVFNFFIERCSIARHRELSHLKIDMPSLIQNIITSENAPSPKKPSLPRKENGSIDYDRLFLRHTSSASPSTS
jgi:hypothetical protein